MDRNWTMKSPLQLIALSLVVILLCLSSTATVTAKGGEEQTFYVGVVPQYDARKIHRIWMPILQALEKSTGAHFKLVGTPTITDFENRLNAGLFDFAYMNPYDLLLANKRQGYTPLVSDITERLHGVLVVKKDSPIMTPAELDGKTVAFPAPNALGASLMIRADLQDIFNIKIRPRYVKTHSSVYLNVVLGVSSAGGGVQQTLDQQPQNIRDALRVLYQTRDVPSHPFSVHPGVPPALARQVRETLLALGKTEHGLSLLMNIPIKNIGATSMEEYRSLQEIGVEQFHEEEQ